MNLIGQKVNHKTFGEGTIIALDGEYLTVQFAEKEGSFKHPDAFQGFLKAVDPTIQATVINEIQTREVAYIVEKEKKNVTDIQKVTMHPNATPHIKPSVVIEREVGKRMTFYVFQGSTFEKEYHGGYIWAPLETASGMHIHHWDMLRNVRLGDVILHGVNGYVQAISVAKGSCYDCEQPVELRSEGSWGSQGRRINCDYTYIPNPIKTSAYRSTILKYCNVKYAPFDKEGNGNMGYLYSIDRRMAKVLIDASAKQNQVLRTMNELSDL